jgi:ABC-type Na+ efflux pump permease subunit
MGIGQYNLDGWDELKSPMMMVVFFVIAILTINVVMLSILIAIISAAYEKVVATQK